VGASAQEYDEFKRAWSVGKVGGGKQQQQFSIPWLPDGMDLAQLVLADSSPTAADIIGRAPPGQADEPTMHVMPGGRREEGAQEDGDSTLSREARTAANEGTAQT